MTICILINCQNTRCSTFAKGPRFLNLVMTFLLHPLSHYNSITESRARFLLSLLEDLIDVHKDMATRDKLIFPSAITQIICHFSISCPESDHFSVMGAIDAATVRQTDAQLRPRRTQTETVAPPTSLAPSTSAPSSMGGVTLDAIMAQLQRMDARLDTLSDELCQVNTHVDRNARQQARLGGFIEFPSHSPEASKEENDDGDSDDDGDEDEDASSSNDDEMTT